jgi:TonB family protein
MHGLKKEPRRSAPRINLRSNQIAYLNFQSGNGGIALDISAAGLGFQAVEPLEPNESLAFRLSVPGFAQINLSGHVIWIDETRKRGGLRVNVPAAQQRAFQLWQQQYIGSQPETKPPIPSPPSLPRPDVAPQPQPGAKQSPISRKVLLACLVLTLCAALADGSQFMFAARRLLSHFGRSSPSATARAVSAPPPSATVLAHHAPRASASGAPQPRAADTPPPKHYDAQLSTPSASAAPAGNLQSHPDPIDAKPIASTLRAASLSAPQPIARRTSANVNRHLVETLRNPDSPRHSPTHPAQRHLQPSRHAHALAASAASPHTLAVAGRSRPISGNQPEAMNSSSLPATSPAAQSPQAFSSQSTGPAANLEPCQLVSSVQPAYPKKAMKRRIQGDVHLRVVVGPDGSVTSVEPLFGPPLLVAAAEDATRQFHYKPALLNGKPIETIQTVSISFKLEP